MSAMLTSFESLVGDRTGVDSSSDVTIAVAVVAAEGAHLVDNCQNDVANLRTLQSAERLFSFRKMH